MAPLLLVLWLVALIHFMSAAQRSFLFTSSTSPRLQTRDMASSAEPDRHERSCFLSTVAVFGLSRTGFTAVPLSQRVHRASPQPLHMLLYERRHVCDFLALQDKLSSAGGQTRRRGVGLATVRETSEFAAVRNPEGDTLSLINNITFGKLALSGGKERRGVSCLLHPRRGHRSSSPPQQRWWCSEAVLRNRWL